MNTNVPRPESADGVGAGGAAHPDRGQAEGVSPPPGPHGPGAGAEPGRAAEDGEPGRQRVT